LVERRKSSDLSLNISLPSTFYQLPNYKRKTP
jgi:hypothetical protein